MKKVKLINKSLEKDINTILEDELKVFEGTVGGYSIEVTEKNPRSFTSYIYYDNKEDRDSDLKTIKELLK